MDGSVSLHFRFRRLMNRLDLQRVAAHDPDYDNLSTCRKRSGKCCHSRKLFQAFLDLKLDLSLTAACLGDRDVDGACFSNCISYAQRPALTEPQERSHEPVHTEHGEQSA